MAFTTQQTNKHVQSKLNNAVREGQHLAHLTLASFSCSRRAITAHQLVQSDLKYVKGPFHRQDAEGELEMGVHAKVGGFKKALRNGCMPKLGAIRKHFGQNRLRDPLSELHATVGYRPMCAPAASSVFESFIF